MADVPFDDFRTSVDRLLIKAPGLLEDLVRATGDEAVRLARKRVSGPVLNKRSGQLWRSIKSTVIRQGDDYTADVTAGNAAVRYAAIHEFGGQINGNPWLTFQVGGGGWRRVASVFIPERPYLRPSVQEAGDLMGERITQAIKAVLP